MYSPSKFHHYPSPLFNLPTSNIDYLTNDITSPVEIEVNHDLFNKKVRALNVLFFTTIFHLDSWSTMHRPEGS